MRLNLVKMSEIKDILYYMAEQKKSDHELEESESEMAQNE